MVKNNGSLLRRKQVQFPCNTFYNCFGSLVACAAADPEVLGSGPRLGLVLILSVKKASAWNWEVGGVLPPCLDST